LEAARLKLMRLSPLSIVDLARPSRRAFLFARRIFDADASALAPSPCGYIQPARGLYFLR
jgi:hypothetical protein